MTSKGKLIIFSAPSGSGKTSIVREIIKSDIPFGFSVSATSREPRSGEINGKDYHFLSITEFKKAIANNEFLEWEEVYENQFYGTLISEVEQKRNQGLNVIFDIDVIGGLNVKKFYGDDSLAIFVQPPSIEELKNRLINRGTETKESLAKRLNKAEHELSYAPQFDTIIVNTVLEDAVRQTLLKLREFVGGNEG